MKIFSVIGISKSGKTTTIENIIKELKIRGYLVGSVKEIHFHNFKMDIEGTNTSRHRDAGASLVTARGENETDILFQEKLSMEEILDFYSHDFVVLEGVRDMDVPKIVTAHDEEGIDARLDETTFVISGRISNHMNEYKGLPVINSETNIKELVDLIEEKVFDRREEKKIVLKVNEKEIPMVPFVKKILINTVEAVVKELDGYEKNGEIEICIKK